MAYEQVCEVRPRAEWLHYRRTGIGASDAAVLLNVSPWKSRLELYAEKVLDGEPVDDEQPEWVEWGNRLEPVIVEAYSERTGRAAERCGVMYRSIEHPFALATLDGWTNGDEGGEPWPLEIKTTGAHRAEDWVDGPPEIYVAQMQWQMLVVGAPRATIACLLGGQRLVWDDVPADPELQSRLLRIAAAFWKSVEERRPPAPDASSSSSRALSRLYPSSEGEAIPLPSELLEVADALEVVRERMKSDEALCDGLENQIKAAMGNAAIGVLPDRRSFSWKSVTRNAYSVEAKTYRQFRAHAAPRR